MVVEELDQRSHEERCDDRTDTDLSGDPEKCEAGGQTEKRAAEDAKKVCDDPANRESDAGLLLRPDQRHGIIGRHAEIRREIERGRQAHDHNGDCQDEEPERKRGLGQQPRHTVLRELRDIAQQKEIDQGGQPDLTSVEYQSEHQKQQIHDHIERPESDGNDSVQPAHKGLERVDAQSGMLEHPYADTADGNAHRTHQNALAKKLCLFHTALLNAPVEGIIFVRSTAFDVVRR